MRARHLLALFLAAAAIACGAPDPAAPDASVADAGGAPVDGGSDPVDAGADPVDAGTDPVDAGDPPIDAGRADGGSEPIDAGSGPVDAGPPQGENVLWNGGFEQWDGALPVAWFGAQSNLPEDSVEQVSTDVFEGNFAARIVNPSDTHKRFTTAATSLRAGRYFCTYMARGHGEVRTARYDTDFSSYTPANFHLVDSDEWTRFTYGFSVASDVFDTFELVFSVRATVGDRGHLVLDDVRCTRAIEPCDTITCDPWARCANATSTCRPLAGRCDADPDCPAWEACDADHRCVVRAGRCNTTGDCLANSPATPVCDRPAHACEAGDPCAGVTCASPRTCQPTTGACGLSPGVCVTTADCAGALPACDRATQRCVEATHAANIFPNGAFESWSTYYVPYRGEHLLPDEWYGLERWGASEIDPVNVRQWTDAPHGGTSAVQFVGGQVALRFTSEVFDIPSGTYSCAYRVRGKGSLRHRGYSSGGWSTWTDFVEVDTDTWTPVFFKAPGNVRDYRLILYPGRTDASRGHLLVDDVVCTRD